jgi:hypothetical protein
MWYHPLCAQAGQEEGMELRENIKGPYEMQ